MVYARTHVVHAFYILYLYYKNGITYKSLTEFGEIAESIGSWSVICNAAFGHQREGIEHVINGILWLMN